jgi:hypothetical protein
MLTRSKSQKGEGSFAEFIPEIERLLRKKIMASEGELSPQTKKLKDALLSMYEMVKVLYEDFLERKKTNLGRDLNEG